SLAGPAARNVVSRKTVMPARSSARAGSRAPLSSRNRDDLYSLLTPICQARSNLVEPDSNLKWFDMAINAESFARPPRPPFTRPTFDDSIRIDGSRLTGQVHVVDESLLSDRIERFKPVGRFVLSLVEHAFPDFDQCFDNACRLQFLDEFSKELLNVFLGLHI